MGKLEVLCGRLKRYFEACPEVAMAFLFGSAVRGQLSQDSDLDIAVYFYPDSAELEWEEQKEYPAEDAIWRGSSIPSKPSFPMRAASAPSHRMRI